MSTRSARRSRNAQLGYWIEQAQVSYAILARELRDTAAACGRPDLCPDRTRIGHWVSSGEQPRPPLPEIIAATLSRLCACTLTPADLGLSSPSALDPGARSFAHPAPPPAPPALAGDPTNRRAALTIIGTGTLIPLLTAAAETATAYARQATTSDLDQAQISDLDLAVHRLGVTYSTYTPRQLWPQAAHYRHQAFELLHHRRHTLREGREVARCAGMLSVVLAWLSHDLGNQAAVEAFAADAKTHGQQADAPEVCAWAEDVLATHALYSKRPLDALAAATRGLAVAPRNGPAAIRMTAQIARAHAMLGNAEGFTVAADLAHAYQDQLPAATSGLFSVDAVRILSYDASSYIWLDDPNQAQKAAGDAIEHYRAISAPTRLAIAQLDLALAHAALGEPSAAVDVGRQALSSDRLVTAVTGRLRQLDEDLRRRYPTLSDVLDFHEQVRSMRLAA
ncbi:hypothetical protein [Microbispora sp. NBRC 16548]|uniref:hypothetical protein n=1 Tax=Microbispora sp. NBRC 16548 TaxID=3030994 RepID=UPI00249FECFE|nr:hypothetical protein [Microbispora sp. NBRC 16548]GLX06593.1 hypothetical protein Misp03_35200 [Microbispora sp. NBRC 16548]